MDIFKNIVIYFIDCFKLFFQSVYSEALFYFVLIVFIWLLLLFLFRKGDMKYG